MAKVQDTYNPVTGEYVKRISDWIELTGDLAWNHHAYVSAKTKRFYSSVLSNGSGVGDGDDNLLVVKYDTSILTTSDTNVTYWTEDRDRCRQHSSNLYLSVSEKDSGFSSTYTPSSNEIKAYFFGYKLANSDGTSPYYKSEVPYNPATWGEWTNSGGSCVKDLTGIEITSNGLWSGVTMSIDNIKPSTKYGVLVDCISKSTTQSFYFGGVYNEDAITQVANKTLVVGKNKFIGTSKPDVSSSKIFRAVIKTGDTVGAKIKLKDIRLFELPTGSQIEADFTNLSADELSAKYTFNGLCVKHWKKVTDGTGLTSTLPTASYAGYTPYKMIYQLATPEISYLTPKATIPLYDTNTIVETDTPSDCKADVTVGYKLKSGVAAVAGDITAPTPDYVSAVNSVSEDGLKNGIVRSPNIVTNGGFANGTTGWSNASGYSVENSESKSIGTGSYASPYQSINMIGGHKYYYVASVKNTSTVSCYSDISGAAGSRLDFQGNSNVYVRKSVVFAKETNSTSNLFLTVLTTTGDGLPRYCDNVQLIDLTATFGAGNEPAKEQCDILFATWQDKASTQATLPTLRKIGTVADTYNPETGVLVQRIGKKVFDGTEVWDTNGAKTAFTTTVSGIVSGQNQTVVCSHYKCVPYVNDIYSALVDNGIGANNSSSTFFGIRHKSLGDTNIGATEFAKFKAYLVQQYANGTPVTVYYQLATPVVTTLTKTALSTYKPTTVIESDSTVKGNVSADYKLKANAAPVAGDFIASPECVNDIKDLGNSIDVVSSNKNKGQVDLSAIPYNTITDGTYKTNILLSAPLRSVGSVKDRLFKDSDGKWKVERNIGEAILTGAHGWNLAGELASVNGLTVYNNALAGVKAASPINCDKLRTLLVGYDDTSVRSPITNAMFVQSNGMFILNIGIEKLAEKTTTGIRNYLNANPMTVQYQLATPTYETLSQELQTDLDNIPTFPEHNYVYTVTNDNLQPTLHVDYKKLSWLKSRLLLNSLKIYSRNLTDAEMIQNYKVEKERFGM